MTTIEDLLELGREEEIKKRKEELENMWDF
jgi:hypothetical protein